MILYHGSSVRFNRFDPAYIGEGHDQYGPGFYLADRYDGAARYASGDTGSVATIEFTPRRIITRQDVRNTIEIRKVAYASSNRQEAFENYGSAGACIKSLLVYEDSVDAFQSVWYEMYRMTQDVEGDREFLREMVRIGIDGAKVQLANQTHTYISFNPDVTRIIGWE